MSLLLIAGVLFFFLFGVTRTRVAPAHEQHWKTTEDEKRDERDPGPPIASHKDSFVFTAW